MIAALTVAIAFGAALVAVYFDRLWNRRSYDDRWMSVEPPPSHLRLHERKLLSDIRDGDLRYEIVLSDHGGNGEMRWRWIIADADRFLAMTSGESTADDIGMAIPYMLGNAPTREEAEADAMSWIAKHGAASVVVR